MSKHLGWAGGFFAVALLVLGAVFGLSAAHVNAAVTVPAATCHNEGNIFNTGVGGGWRQVSGGGVRNTTQAATNWCVVTESSGYVEYRQYGTSNCATFAGPLPGNTAMSACSDTDTAQHWSLPGMTYNAPGLLFNEAEYGTTDCASSYRTLPSDVVQVSGCSGSGNGGQTWQYTTLP